MQQKSSIPKAETGTYKLFPVTYVIWSLLRFLQAGLIWLSVIWSYAICKQMLAIFAR